VNATERPVAPPSAAPYAADVHGWGSAVLAPENGAQGLAAIGHLDFDHHPGCEFPRQRQGCSERLVVCGLHARKLSDQLREMGPDWTLMCRACGAETDPCLVRVVPL
jgi:hypothetical protein